MPSSAEPVTDQNRNISIDTLRGLACIALVSFHVVGYSPASGMELPADHWLVRLNLSLVDMRMPLFSFLSGVVFIALEQTRRPIGQIMSSKLRRLFLPLVSVGCVFWLARASMGHLQQPLWTIPFFPFAHYWFLQATLLIMASFLALNALRLGHSLAIAVLMMGVGTAWWIMGPQLSTNLFSAMQALYLMPFFMLGYVCSYAYRTGAWQFHLAAWPAALIITCLVCLGFMLAVEIFSPAPLVRRLLTLGIGAGFCLTLLAFAPRSAFLARIGHFSYAIYLFHVFFTAGMRELMLQAWPLLSDGLLWMSGICAGLLGPIIVYHMLVQNTYLSGIFLGTRIKPGSDQPVLPVAHSPGAQRA
ncbi:MAG: acyltransferase [Aliishimia sp.]